MQHTIVAKSNFRPRAPSRRTALTAAGLFALLLTGCGGSPGELEPRAKDSRPYEGYSLTLSCPDSRLAEILTPMAQVWGARTGANVVVSSEPMAAGEVGDVGVVSSADLGTLAQRGDLLPVPGNLKEPGHPFQWSAVFPEYRGEPYAGWGSQLYGIPLAAPGYILLYRADRFNDPEAKTDFAEKHGRPLSVPATWEDFAEIAAFFTDRDKRPSLPPLPTEPGRLVDLFSRIASCYDRPALSEAGAATAALERERLAFQFGLDDGQPRLTAPSFVEAASWFAGLRARGCLPDAAAANNPVPFRDSQAVMGIVALDELARLREGRKKLTGFGVAPLPGSKFYFDPQTGNAVPSPPNYVPHHAAGWIGVVGTSSKHPQAAWDLLAELGGPTRSLEIIGAGGFGPTRDSHLDRDRLVAWYGYGFDDDQSKALQDALRTNVGKTVRNPTFGLRGPEHPGLTAALAGELNQVVAGKAPAEQAMNQAAAAWDKTAGSVPPDQWKQWRRHAMGLN